MSKNEENQKFIEKVDNDTGEIIQNVIGFKPVNRWNPPARKGLDYSRKLEKNYIEVAPYAKDEKGIFINEKSVPLLKEVEPIDVDAQIQSYKDDVDVYKILEKWLLSGDNSLINPNGRKSWTDMPSGQVYDYTEYPESIHDLVDSFDGATDLLNGLDNNVINDIVNGDKDSNVLAAELNPEPKLEPVKEENK